MKAKDFELESEQENTTSFIAAWKRTHLPSPRPFLKWAGGKGQLLPELLDRVRRARPYARYHEPFLGGGALFFELARGRGLPRAHSCLSDANARLIETYASVRDHVEEIIALLQAHQARHCEAYFYATRAQVPDSPVARAARIIYLNRTCFNGLYRENSRGEFNVPYGRYRNPAICDAENLRNAAVALKRACLSHGHFIDTLKTAKRGDLVYLDPPYHPVSKTSSFTSYEQSNFGRIEQTALRDCCMELHRRGVAFILSNSCTPFILELYKSTDFRVEIVEANRMVNSKGDRRGKIPEVLMLNF